METITQREPQVNAFFQVPKGTLIKINLPSIMTDKVKEARIAFQNEIARITAEREADRRLILKRAKDDGVGIVHVFDREYPRGGVTVAFKKASPYVTGRMVEVAVATCSPEDVFSRKIGTHLALEQFFYGSTIQLPLFYRYADEDLNGSVKEAFTNMLGYN